MPGNDVDVVVIGMGPGGEDAAARLARAGLTVVGVEARLVLPGDEPEASELLAEVFTAGYGCAPGWPPSRLRRGDGFTR